MVYSTSFRFYLAWGSSYIFTSPLKQNTIVRENKMIICLFLSWHAMSFMYFNIIIFIHTPIILVRKICHPFWTFSQWSTVKEVFSSPISRLTYSYSLTDRRTDEQTDGRTEGPTDGPEGRTDRRTDRQTDILSEIEVDKSSVTWQNVIQELV